jgi:uncharacterized damage-inducible protein DinB
MHRELPLAAIAVAASVISRRILAMDVKDAIRASANLSSHVLKTYVGDLEDSELMQRPSEGSNHLAWQLGHLISAEVQLLQSIRPGYEVELPAGFSEAHAKENCGSDDAATFWSKQAYLDLFAQVRQASLKALAECPATDLDNPAPEPFREHFPTVGDLFTLIANHPMMHAGQFAVARRRLGKPVLL